MYQKIPPVMTAEQLLSRALTTSKKIQIQDKSRQFRLKKTVIARTDSFIKSICTPLERYIKEFPSLDNLPLFYQEIIDIKIDKNKLKQSLGAVDWAQKTCKMIYKKQAGFLKKTGNLEFLKQKQHEIIGRVASVVKQVDSNLKILIDAQMLFKQLPEIQDVPTAVIAGYPNVGKSSLLRCLSAAKPKVAQYPFTTQTISIGHIEVTQRYVTQQFQIIDTPGLLDRPLSERNDVERQAIAALAHLADLTIFLIDPSETCGYSLKDQCNLLTQIQHLFHTSTLLIVENKVDVKNTSSKNLKISCKNAKGIEELKSRILAILQNV